MKPLSLSQKDALDVMAIVGWATPSSVYVRTLDSLVRLGLVQRDGEGRYRLTDAGKAAQQGVDTAADL